MISNFQRPQFAFILEEYLGLEGEKASNFMSMVDAGEKFSFWSKWFPDVEITFDPATWRISSSVLESDPRTISTIYTTNERLSQCRACWSQGQKRTF